MPMYLPIPRLPNTTKNNFPLVFLIFYDNLRQPTTTRNQLSTTFYSFLQHSTTFYNIFLHLAARKLSTELGRARPALTGLRPEPPELL